MFTHVRWQAPVHWKWKWKCHGKREIHRRDADMLNAARKYIKIYCLSRHEPNLSRTLPCTNEVVQQTAWIFTYEGMIPLPKVRQLKSAARE